MAEEAKAVVGQWLAAWNRKDLTAMRLLLADDLLFEGSMDRFTSGDADHALMCELTKAVTEVKPLKVWADGRDVAAFYDLSMSKPAGTYPIAEWFEVQSGKIRRIHSVFDARPFVGG